MGSTGTVSVCVGQAGRVVSAVYAMTSVRFQIVQDTATVLTVVVVVLKGSKENSARKVSLTVRGVLRSLLDVTKRLPYSYEPSLIVCQCKNNHVS